MESLIFLLIVLALLCLCIFIIRTLATAEFQKWLIGGFAIFALIVCILHYFH